MVKREKYSRHHINKMARPIKNQTYIFNCPVGKSLSRSAFLQLKWGFSYHHSSTNIGNHVPKLKIQIKDNFSLKFHSSELFYLFKWGRFWLLKLSTPKWIINLCGVPQLSIAPKTLIRNNFCKEFFLS